MVAQRRTLGQWTTTAVACIRIIELSSMDAHGC